jgi:hypothetical protein
MSTATRFQVGDQVTFSYGRSTMTGEITEDRGPLGLEGRRIYQVRVSRDPFEPETWEMSEDDLEPAPDRETLRAGMNMSEVEAYLARGGLVTILQSNLSGGRDQPHVWLRPNTLGNVTYTFAEERGVLGGEKVPFLLLHDGKILTHRKDEAIAYIQTFGLDRDAAERVVAAVGTAP